MRIEVRLLLSFKEKAPDGEKLFELELSPGATVTDALESLRIPSSSAKVIVVNGRTSKSGQELKNGDQLTVFPPLEGG
ncbi:MAG: MoaD/ThiS family protein [Desulfobacterales bacterium]|jgi:sulfur carrier protein ThiS